MDLMQLANTTIAFQSNPASSGSIVAIAAEPESTIFASKCPGVSRIPFVVRNPYWVAKNNSLHVPPVHSKWFLGVQTLSKYVPCLAVEQSFGLSSDLKLCRHLTDCVWDY